MDNLFLEDFTRSDARMTLPLVLLCSTGPLPLTGTFA